MQIAGHPDLPQLSSNSLQRILMGVSMRCTEGRHNCFRCRYDSHRAGWVSNPYADGFCDLPMVQLFPFKTE